MVAAEESRSSEAAHWITRTVRSRARRPACVPSAGSFPASSRFAASADGNEIIFPASTIGRKGAYERAKPPDNLACALRLAGPVLEDAGFGTVSDDADDALGLVGR